MGSSSNQNSGASAAPWKPAPVSTGSQQYTYFNNQPRQQNSAMMQGDPTPYQSMNPSAPVGPWTGQYDYMGRQTDNYGNLIQNPTSQWVNGQAVPIQPSGGGVSGAMSGRTAPGRDAQVAGRPDRPVHAVKPGKMAAADGNRPQPQSQRYGGVIQRPVMGGPQQQLAPLGKYGQQGMDPNVEAWTRMGQPQNMAPGYNAYRPEYDYVNRRPFENGKTVPMTNPTPIPISQLLGPQTFELTGMPANLKGF